MRRKPFLETSTCILALAGALPALGTVADDLCTGDPCVIAGTHIISDRSVLNFGVRAVVLDGTLDVGSGEMTLTAGSYTQNGQVRARGGGDAGGIVSISALTDIDINASPIGDSFVMDGLDGGLLQLASLLGSVLVTGGVDLGGGFLGFGGDLDVSALGSVSIGAVDLSATDGGLLSADAGGNVTLGHLDLNGGSPDGSGGEVSVTTSGGDVELLGFLDARGGSGGLGGRVFLDAPSGVVRVRDGIEVRGPGGDGGDVEIITNTFTLTGWINADGGFGGGQIRIGSSALAELLGPVTSEGTSADGDGGQIALASSGGLVLADRVSASAGSQGIASSVDLSACTLDSTSTSLVESLGAFGSILVTSGGSMTLRGSFAAGPAAGRVELRYGEALLPPDIAGATISPAPVQILDPAVQCPATTCGNGVVEPGEQCDDAGESVSCDPDCSFSSCGDLALNATAGEVCDEGGESATCDIDCTPVACGDGVVNGAAGEGCDDAGLEPGDGCDGSCQVEPGFTCSGEPSQCAPATGCPAAPTVCSEEAVSTFSLKDRQSPADGGSSGNGATAFFSWVKGSWIGGGAVSQSTFGDPPAGDGVNLCFYENGALVASWKAPGGSLWQPISDRGYRYTDPSSSSDGLRKLVLKGGDPKRARIVVLAKGPLAPVPSLPRVPGFENNSPLVSSFDTQLHIDGTTSCFGMSYAEMSTPRLAVDKDSGLFKLKRTGP